MNKELGLDPAKVNPNGGAVALGHPIGATGCILTVKAMYELQRTGGRYALDHDVHRRRPGHRGDHRAACDARRGGRHRRRVRRYRAPVEGVPSAITRSLVVALTVSAYWLGVGAMVVRARRQQHRDVGLVPEQRAERVHVAGAGAARRVLDVRCRGSALTHERRAVRACPRSRGHGSRYAPLRWLAAAVAVLCLVADDRSAGGGWATTGGWTSATASTSLITDGLFARIRHPIYAFSMLLMLRTALVLPTLPMLVVALVHVALMNVKARNEERTSRAMHGDAYRRYVARTGRFLPRLAARKS